MGIGSSSQANNKLKRDQEDIVFCIICYENDIKSHRLGCGHAFCYDCISSIYEYEDCPRCPLCRRYICIETNKTLENDDVKWFKLVRKCANLLAVVASCGVFGYNILPSVKGYFPDWDLTTIHGLVDDFRIEFSRVKETLF